MKLGKRRSHFATVCSDVSIHIESPSVVALIGKFPINPSAKTIIDHRSVPSCVEFVSHAHPRRSLRFFAIDFTFQRGQRFVSNVSFNDGSPTSPSEAVQGSRPAASYRECNNETIVINYKNISRGLTAILRRRNCWTISSVRVIAPDNVGSQNRWRMGSGCSDPAILLDARSRVSAKGFLSEMLGGPPYRFSMRLISLRHADWIGSVTDNSAP